MSAAMMCTPFNKASVGCAPGSVIGFLYHRCEPDTVRRLTREAHGTPPVALR